MPSKKTSRATITDIAELAGVSIATVSRVVNGTAEVDPEMADRVRAAVKELNYRPHAAARGLKTQKTHTLGLVLPEIGGAYFAEMLKAIETKVKQDGYSLLVYSTYQPEQSQVESVQPLGSHNTDGILVFADSASDADLIRLHKQGFPQVLLHRSAPKNTEIPMVTIENKLGTYKLVTHLIEYHGYRRIAFLSGPAEHEDSYWREQGYRQALDDHGIPFDPALVVPGGFDDGEAKITVWKWLADGIEIDAIFAGDDTAAFGAISALSEAGKKVPEDVAVVGFDDLPLSQYVSPALTTVSVPIATVGQLAVEKLLGLIRSEPVELATLLPTELVIRHSCGC